MRFVSSSTMGQRWKRRLSFPSGIGGGAKKGCRCWSKSSRRTCGGGLPRSSDSGFFKVSLNRERLEAMAVSEYVDLYVV